MFMPAEWEYHSGCWMAWPYGPETWNDEIENALASCALIAQTIARYEPVTVVCAQGDASEASLICGPGIKVVPLPLGDGRIRDVGPGFVVDGHGGLAGVHWRFAPWEERPATFADDAALGRRLLEHLTLPIYAAPLVLEGGAITVDGEGTLIATESCLLDPRRNPGLDRREVTALLCAYTGARTVIWLGEGYEDGPDGGRVDEVACFVRPGAVLALTCDDPADGNYDRLRDNLDRLKTARDARGRALDVITVRQPARQELDGVRLPLSYTSLYLANDGVVMPAFEDPADREAFRTIRRLFPDREVNQVPALDIGLGASGIHRMTLHQPAR